MNHACEQCLALLEELGCHIEFADHNPLLPDKPGVYMVVARKRRCITGAITVWQERVATLAQWWPSSIRFFKSRLERLKRLNKCQILYIGGAGVRGNLNRSIADRYRDLRGGAHTVQLPLGVLASLGWELELWYKCCTAGRARQLEEEYLDRFSEAHGRRPAMNDPRHQPE